MPNPTPDPRPLLGEPISIDLLNTVWRDAAGEHDLLADAEGLRTWLTSHSLDSSPTSEEARQLLVAAREALRQHAKGLLAPPPPRSAERQLNSILASGWFSRALQDGRPVTRPVVVDPAQLAVWTAIENYLQLLERDPGRLRACANPDCILHFFDISKRGDRRWCSMAGCGNRAKAARHYARQRQQ